MLGSLFSKLFDKRKAAPAPRSPGERKPDSDGVLRHISRDTFEGEFGPTLKALGFGADDPSNLALTPQTVDAQMKRRYKLQEDFARAWNEKLEPGVEVLPWDMIPFSVWKTPLGGFLFRQDLYPFDLWNTMLLPADARSALILDLPQHPRAIPRGLAEGAEQFLGGLVAHVMEAHRKTTQAMSNGDFELTGFGAVLDEANRNIRTFASYLAHQQFGEAAFQRHLQLFGRSLGYNIPEAAN